MKPTAFFSSQITFVQITFVTTLLLTPSLAMAEEYVIPLGDFGGRPMVEVTIDGNGPYNMILDTGAPSVVLSQDIGKELGLNVVGERRIGSPGGKGVTALRYGGARIGVGGYSFDVEGITGMDFSMFNRRPQRAQGTEPAAPKPKFPPGVIGFWTLTEGVVSIDYVSDTLTIAPEAELNPNKPGVTKLTTEGSFPFPEFEMSVAGVEVMGHVDSGSGYLFTMSTDWIEKLPLKEEAKITSQGMLADGPRDIWTAQLDGDVVIAGHIIHDPVINFVDGFSGVNVGSVFFQNGGFRIDRENDLIEIIRGNS